MIGKKKHIKFTYYEVIAQENDREVLYDLNKWLNVISKKSLEERKKAVGTVQGRLETATIIEGTGFYALNFMRLDEASDAYKAKADKKAEHIDLADDEYLGRNTVAVYDPQKHVILIQNNRGSYSVNAIQNYINVTNNGEKCFFRPIMANFDAGRCRKSKIKKLYAKCSSAEQFDADGSKTFERIIESCEDLGGYTFCIEIGIGRGKERQLNNQNVYEAVNTLLRNKGCLSTAKISLADDKADAVYDLIDNLRMGEFNLVIPERGEADFEKIAWNMYHQYINV